MTLALALACRGGVIFAADSQATEDTGIRRVTNKIEIHEPSGLVWAGTGDGAMLQSVTEALHAELDKASERSIADPPQLRGLLRRTVSRTMKTLIADLVVSPESQPEYTKGKFLFARCESSPTIIEVECIGKATDYSDVGFQAIGSGGPVAQVAHRMFEHFDLAGRNVEQAKVIAYRMIAFAIDSFAQGIGFPVHMVVAESGSGIIPLGESEIEGLLHTVDLWKQTEAESLPGLSASQDEDE